MLRKIDQALLTELIESSRHSPRRRDFYNLHASHDEPVQKLFIAMQQDSYIRPHRHMQKEKTELFMTIRGRFALLLFEDSGRVMQRVELTPQGEVFACEVRPGTWHTVVALEDDSVFFEAKQGPYIALSDKDFAPWSPAEQTPQVSAFLNWLSSCHEGDVPPSQ